jgi:hypothetical protein
MTTVQVEDRVAFLLELPDFHRSLAAQRGTQLGESTGAAPLQEEPELPTAQEGLPSWAALIGCVFHFMHHSKWPISLYHCHAVCLLPRTMKLCRPVVLPLLWPRLRKI